MVLWSRVVWCGVVWCGVVEVLMKARKDVWEKVPAGGRQVGVHQTGGGLSQGRPEKWELGKSEIPVRIKVRTYKGETGGTSAGWWETSGGTGGSPEGAYTVVMSHGCGGGLLPTVLGPDAPAGCTTTREWGGRGSG